MQNRNRSIERQMQLNDALLEMKNHNSSLSVVKEKMRKQEEEEKQRLIRREMRDKINRQLEVKRLQELELKQQKEESSMLLGKYYFKPSYPQFFLYQIYMFKHLLFVLIYLPLNSWEIQATRGWAQAEARIRKEIKRGRRTQEGKREAEGNAREAEVYSR